MKLLPALFLSALVALSAQAGAQDATAVEDAKEAARAWLAQVDDGKYAESWDSAAAASRDKVSRAAWAQSIGAVRVAQGPVKTRVPAAATFTRTLPGAPAGEYVVVQYRTEFTKAPAAVETVIPMREKDGAWKVSGYFIQ